MVTLKHTSMTNLLLDEQAIQPPKETNKEFHDAQENKELTPQREPKLSRTQQKKLEIQLHRAMLRLIHGQQKLIEIQPVQVKESKMRDEKENDLQERDNVTGKSHFLSWVGAYDCVKDKVIGNYSIQVMGIDTKETKPTQPKVNH